MLGHLLYIALLILPGLALIKWLKVDTKDDLSESLGLAFGLSTVITTLVVAVKTLGNLYVFSLVGLTKMEALGILIISIVALILYSLKTRSLLLPKPKSRDLIIFLSVIALLIIVAAHFTKYPIFPKYPSADFIWHVRLSRELEAGTYFLVPSGLLYFGAQAQIALAHQLMNGLLLVDAQHAFALLVLLSPFLVYACAKRAFENTKAGSVAAVIYVLTGFVWYGSVFNAGLYANFYGILATLALLTLMAFLAQKPTKLLWLIYILTILNLYLSHYTVLIFILALPLGLVLYLIQRRKVDMALPVLMPLLIGAVGLAIFPAQLSTLTGFLQPTGYEAVLGDTNLSYQLRFLPVLRYLAAVITQDLSTVLLLALLILSIPFAFKLRSPLAKLPFLWALIALASAPLGPTAWRFSYAALMPLVLCASSVLPNYVVEEKLPVSVSKKRAKVKRLGTKRYSALILIALVLSTYGWSHVALADSFESTELSNLAQVYVYESMVWMKENLEPGAKVITVTDWRIESYLSEISGIQAKLLFLAKPENAIDEARRGGYGYVVLTVFVPEKLPEGFKGGELIKSYLDHPLLSLQYKNPNVYIFKIK